MVDRQPKYFNFIKFLSHNKLTRNLYNFSLLLKKKKKLVNNTDGKVNGVGH